MKNLELYKFITNNNIEYHRNEHKKMTNVIVFIPFNLISEFVKIIGSGILDEGGLDCVLKDGYIAIWMLEICEYLDVELLEVFDKKDSN